MSYDEGIPGQDANCTNRQSIQSASGAALTNNFVHGISMVHRRHRYIIIPIGILSLVCLSTLFYVRIASDPSLRTKTALEFNVISEDGYMWGPRRSYYLEKVHKVIRVSAQNDSIDIALKDIKKSFDSFHTYEDSSSVIGIRFDRKCRYSAFVSVVDILERRMMDSLDISYGGGVDPVILFWHSKHDKNFGELKDVDKPQIERISVFRSYRFLLDKPFQSFIILTAWLILFVISVRKSSRIRAFNTETDVVRTTTSANTHKNGAEL